MVRYVFSFNRQEGARADMKGELRGGDATRRQRRKQPLGEMKVGAATEPLRAGSENRVW